MKTLRTQAGLTCLLLTAVILGACRSNQPLASATKEIQSQQVQNVVVALLNEKGELAMGQNRFIIAFRSAAGKQPVDVGTVMVASSMAMPGMAPMTAPIELEPTGTKGQYAAKGEFSMSGAWKFEVRWDGPAGSGTAVFNTNVR
ncbi:MAG: FixH family protein [Bryobacterales bacterium]|jgi:hypothetical protein|nr:FixH family protein [Bryobacterales bacterium]